MPKPEDSQPALGVAIRALRLKRGLTQEDLAHAAGVRTATISVLERGRSNPSWGTVRSIARALNVTVAQIARLSEEDAGEDASRTGVGSPGNSRADSG
jgi:XRE family transcriptional regulator, regulator of sulfur utilization